MKKLFALFTLLTFCFAMTIKLYAEIETLTVTASTNSIATLTLDTRKGTAVPLPTPGLAHAVIRASAPSSAGNTNGNLVLYIETAPARSGPWTDYTQSNIKVTVSGLGAATNSNADVYNLSGYAWVRMGAASNSTAATYTNFSLTIAYPQPTSHR